MPGRTVSDHPSQVGRPSRCTNSCAGLRRSSTTRLEIIFLTVHTVCVISKAGAGRIVPTECFSEPGVWITAVRCRKKVVQSSDGFGCIRKCKSVQSVWLIRDRLGSLGSVVLPFVWISWQQRHAVLSTYMSRVKNRIDVLRKWFMD